MCGRWGISSILRLMAQKYTSFSSQSLELTEGSPENSQNPLGFAASPVPMVGCGIRGLVIPKLVLGHRATTANYLELTRWLHSADWLGLTSFCTNRFYANDGS